MPDAKKPQVILGETEVVAVGILTALVKAEMIPTEEVLLAAGWSEHPTIGELTNAGVQGWSKVVDGMTRYAFTMSFSKMGQAMAAAETMVFLRRCKPSLVVLTGIAGSLWKDDYAIGDVVVATDVQWRQQDRVRDGSPCDVYRPRPIGLRLAPDADDGRFLAKFVAKQYANGINGNAVHAEMIFTWDYVVDSAKWTAKLNADYEKAACVEMEAGGFLTGVERHFKVEKQAPVTALIVRGISDYTEKKTADRSQRATASRHSAEVSVALIEHYLTRENFPRLEKQRSLADALPA